MGTPGKRREFGDRTAGLVSCLRRCNRSSGAVTPRTSQLATSFMDPPPIWRAVAMFIGGAVVTLLASLSANGAGSLEGAGLAIALGVGILILAALQIRGILMRR